MKEVEGIDANQLMKNPWSAGWSETWFKGIFINSKCGEMGQIDECIAELFTETWRMWNPENLPSNIMKQHLS